MNKIQRPNTLAKAAIMLHLAEYLLGQVDLILSCLAIAPDHAIPHPIGARVDKAYKLVHKALKTLDSNK